MADEKKVKQTRTAQPVYVFVSVSPEGKAEATRTFRKPIDMAKYMQENGANGEQLLIVTPS